jgi:uncharacterized GH25 family protein
MERFAARVGHALYIEKEEANLEAMLHKMARQLASMDEASLMALWDTYHSRVKQFEPTHSWEEACIVFGLIQAVRWKNQLFNNQWSEQKEAGLKNGQEQERQTEESAKMSESDAGSSADRGKVIQFHPRGSK